MYERALEEQRFVTSFLQLAGSSRDHDYVSAHVLVCQTAQSGCNADLIRSVLPAHAVPNLNRTVADNSINPVVTSFGVYIGDVRTTFSSDGLSVRNTTLANHHLRWGSVTVTNFQQGGAWWVVARGVGTNITSGHSMLNQAIGPTVFNAHLTSYASVVRSRLRR